MSRLSTEVAGTPASGIRALANAAWQLPDAVHLEFGEPDFDTPRHIVAAADAAARAGHTRYGPSAGLPALRTAIVAKLARDNAWSDVRFEDVVVTAGGVGGLFAAYRTLLSAGDEILVPDPGWTNFTTLAHLVGATARGYGLLGEDNFDPDYAELDRLCGARTKAIVINSPSNPVGFQWTAEQLTRLGDWANRRGLTVVADECYDQLWLDVPTTSFAVAAPATPAITVYSLSKSYAMTGWRIGYTVASGPGRDELAAGIARVQEASVSCVNTVTQYAGVEALTGPQDCVAAMRDAYRSRRDAAVRQARELGLSAVRPAGAFYLWLSTGSTVDMPAVALDLLRDQGVALAPGTAFGAHGAGALRLSLAAAPASIERGLTGLAEFLKRPST